MQQDNEEEEEVGGLTALTARRAAPSLCLAFDSEEEDNEGHEGPTNDDSNDQQEEEEKAEEDEEKEVAWPSYKHESIEFHSVLGQGQDRTVHGARLATGREVAALIVTATERQVLKHLARRPNNFIPTIFGESRFRGELWLLQERAAGDLRSFLVAEQDPSWAVVWGPEVVKQAAARSCSLGPAT
mmetsp:Transcript_49663/g.106924  ORF Transcript_49663/g.106924 Transcript_49663/m.106924 type:complete len:185 (+) Transcript_49663:745-1299(+)